MSCKGFLKAVVGPVAVTALLALAVSGDATGPLSHLAGSAQAAAGNAASKAGKTTCEGQDLLALIAERDPETAARVKPDPSDARNDGAVLYEVTKEGLAPSYLFGTVHLSDPRVTALSPATTKALKSSKIFALEVAELSPAATAQAVAQASDLVLLENGKTIESYLSDDEFKIVADRLEQADTPVHLARRFKPWVISMIMAVSTCERQKIAKGGLVLDMKLAEIAREAGIPVVGLESIEDQLRAAAAVPLEDQIRLLRASIAYAERANDLRETVLQLYLDRKFSYAVPLQVVLAERAGLDGDILRAFRRDAIEARNRQMTELIDKLYAEGGAFVAIGSLHLPGENGVVALLRRAGYTVVGLE